MTTLEIHTNKARLAFLTFLFTASVTLAVLLMYYLYLDGIFSIELILVLIIAVPVVIFMLWVTIKKISSNKPGLVIDSRGIVDNINLSEVGIIPWSSIEGINMVKHQYSYFIILHLKNSDSLLKRLQGNRLRLAKNNIKIFGSPVVVNASSLKIEKGRLFGILNNEIKVWNK